MRVLLVNYMETTAPGGINKAVREIAKNLSENGNEVIVLQSNPFNLPHEEDYCGFKIIRVKSKFEKQLYGLNLDMHVYFKKYLKKLNPDIIHVHGYHTLFSLQILYLIKKVNSDIPVLFSPHFDIFSHETFGGKYLWNIYNKFMGKRINNYACKTIAASEFEAENINKLLNVPKNKIRVIPHGVDKIDLDKYNSVDDTIQLLYVGYLLELKGVHFIIETLHELIYNKKVNSFLTIVGEGPFRNKLEKIAIKLDVMDFIEWKGFIHSNNSLELLNNFKKADILLLLSKSENYGIVIPESLTMGTPTIVTKRTALTEFLNEPGCFSVNYPPNSEEVADLIIKIINDNMEVGPFSNKIKTWNEIALTYEQLYLNLINKKVN